jgi:hypothetical protein
MVAVGAIAITLELRIPWRAIFSRSGCQSMLPPRGTSTASPRSSASKSSVSGGSNPEYAEWVFAEAGIDLKRLHLDYRAVDTVTNFTTLVDELKARNINSIYLITFDLLA